MDKAVLNRSNPRFLTPFGASKTGQRGGRETTEALARLHSGRVAQSRRSPSLPGAGGRQRPHPGRASSAARLSNPQELHCS